MRRLFIWSALAVVIGLALAGGGYWAYWTFHARFQPVVVARHQSEIQRLLDESSWISAGGGGAPLYIVGYRDSAAMRRYEREEIPKLRAAGVEARIIVFARPDREGLAQSTAAERATVAELWLTRDRVLYQRWTDTPSRNWTAAGIPAADGNLARAAVVEAGRDFVAALSAYLDDAGLKTRYPLIVWRDRQGFMKACACSDSQSWAFIRDDLGAPDWIDPEPVTGGSGGPLPYPDGGGASLPYPALPPIPPAGGGAAPVDPAVTPPPAAAPAPAAPAARRPVRPSTPPPPPKARRSDDTTFF